MSASRPRLLDLFCCAGGAGMGYHRAGFEVVGVDVENQPHYPFAFYRHDALAVLDGDTPIDLSWFDVIHASPPCQDYSVLAGMHPDTKWPRLIEPTRTRLLALGLPFIMENVENAPLQRAPGLFGVHGFRLCGTAFGLGARGMELRRHRLFETNLDLPAAPPCVHKLKTIGVYGHGGHSGKHRMAHADEAREAMGIDWMNRDEMCEAIPPAYAEWIGRQLLTAIKEAA